MDEPIRTQNQSTPNPEPPKKAFPSEIQAAIVRPEAKGEHSQGCGSYTSPEGGVPAPLLKSLLRGHSLLEWLTLIFDIVAVIILAFYTVYANRQWKVMNGQLEQMKGSSVQTDRLIEKSDSIANSMAASVKQSQTALDETLKQNLATLARTLAQGRAALDTSIDASHLDQRAWVGVAEFATISGEQTPDGKTFSFKGVQIAIRNSGKTPAINLSAVTMQTTRDWRDKKIGDYDVVIAEFNRNREESSAKLLSEMIQRNPQMAETIRAREKEMRDMEAQAMADLFPAGQVLAPGVAITQGTPSASYGIRDDMGMRRLTIYILGKITYSDIFTGTRLHTTKFCLMRLGGTQFVSCPTGNYMD